MRDRDDLNDLAFDPVNQQVLELWNDDLPHVCVYESKPDWRSRVRKAPKPREHMFDPPRERATQTCAFAFEPGVRGDQLKVRLRVELNPHAAS